MSHIERIRKEKNELQIKINALSDFTTTQVFLDLEEYDQQLLEEQLKHMVDYNVILGRRLYRAGHK